MIRFHCPLCDKPLKAPEEKAGAGVVCPRCQERSVVPADAAAGGEERPAVRPHGDDALPPFPALGRGGRWALAAAGGVAALSLVLAVAAPYMLALEPAADAVKCAAILLIPSCAVVALVVLYGAATGCPSCDGWWTRNTVQKEFVDREVYEKDGVPFARSTYRTTYECTACRHRWSAISTDEYKEMVRDRPRHRMG